MSPRASRHFPQPKNFRRGFPSRNLTNTWSSLKSVLTLLAVALVATFAVGCGGGSDRDSFVATGATQGGTGNLTFNFTRAQTTVNVPPGTTNLEFTFFDAQNQSGNITLTTTRAFATTITITGVPTSTQSFRIIATNANGATLATITGNVTVTLNGTTVVDLSGVTVTVPQPSASAINVLVSNNGTGNAGDLDLFDRINNLVRTITSGSNQGITLDKLSTGYHNGNTDVRILNKATTRTGAFNTNMDRLYNVPSSSAIKGSDYIQSRGLMILADFGASNLYLVSSAGTSGKFFQALPAGGKPWDVLYDDTNDRLFVAFSEGSVSVYDNFVGGNFNQTPSRTFTSQGLDNAHGIAYDLATDTLFISDVGAVTTGANSDGEIFIFSNASTATGSVIPKAIIGGSNTMLGNPVDIDFANGDLRVAEKTNDKLLIFANILQSTGGNIAPTVATTETKPESLTSQAAVTVASDNSDIDGGATVQNILVSTNPSSATPPTGSFIRMSPTLTGNSQFDPGLGFATESIKVDTVGDVFMTGDNLLGQFNRVASGVRDTSNSRVLNQDRVATATGSFKGLDVVDSRGVIIVADVSGSVKVFGKYGDLTTPITTTTTPGNPWDVDYDVANDRLYVALTNGSVAVYDNYFANSPTTATRTITFGATNAHGIVHDAANNVLLVSDVGATTGGTNTDGRLFVIANASTASGAVTPSVTISGAATNLGDPVDVAYDGTNLYVAEKSLNFVHRFDNIRASNGGNVAPSISRAVTKPESVSLITGL